MLRASQLRPGPAWPVGSAQTTTGASQLLGLFWLDAAEDVKHQLDDAVVLELGHADQLATSSDDDPERRMMKKVHGSTMWACFQRSHAPLNATNPLECFTPIFFDVNMQHL